MRRTVGSDTTSGTDLLSGSTKEETMRIEKILSICFAGGLLLKGLYDKINPLYSNTYNMWMDIFRSRNKIPHHMRYIGGCRMPICKWPGLAKPYYVYTNEFYSTHLLPKECLVYLYHSTSRYNLNYSEPIYDSVTKTYYYTAYCKLAEIPLSQLLTVSQPDSDPAFVLTYDNPDERLTLKPNNARLKEFLITETRKRFWNDPKYKIAEWIC